MNEDFNFNKTKALNLPYVKIALRCIWSSSSDFHIRPFQFQARRIIRGYKSVRVMTISHLNTGYSRSPKGFSFKNTHPQLQYFKEWIMSSIVLVTTECIIR